MRHAAIGPRPPAAGFPVSCKAVPNLPVIAAAPAHPGLFVSPDGGRVWNATCRGQQDRVSGLRTNLGGREMVTARRLGRWALYGLGGCVVLLVLVRAGLAVYLGTPAGRAMVA